jgi:peptidoglycan/LPS O-acetylase OafA/YrhL
MTKINHQKHIDGLRAIAVLPVIFYHANFELFSGGFIGVDVFFVISGYLITSIIYKQMMANEFSLGDFYCRRIKRIFPVLFFIMFISFPFAWVLLSPVDLVEFSKSIIGVSLFSSNILFWRQSGYFTTAAEYIPFLHTWSLSVEEQFYLVFPLFCFFIIKKKEKYLIPGILSIWSISFILSLIISYWKPGAAFFLSFFRAYELLTGSLIALFYNQLSDLVRRSWIRSSIATAGLLLILVAMVFIDKWTVFPGIAVILPVIGASLIILYSDANNLTGRLLGNSILVNIGLISFSLYLWHNLLFTFARFHGFAYSNSYAFEYLTLISLILSYFTWRFVENPFRYALFITPRIAIKLALFFSLSFIIIGSICLLFEGFPGRFSEPEKDILKFREYNSAPYYKNGSCFLEFGDSNDDFDNSCIPDKNDRESVVIWGDSHAAALSFGLRMHFKNLGQFTRSACPPVLGGSLDLSKICNNFNHMALQQILLAMPKKIFLHANWLLYDNENIIDSVHDTISYLNKHLPESQIILIGLVPQYPNTLPDYIVRSRIKLNDSTRLSSLIIDDLVKLENLFLMAENNLKYYFLSPLNYFCNSRDCLIAAQFEDVIMPMAWDYGHLTAAGSVFLANSIIKEDCVNYVSRCK